ncbi:chemotaxis protein CheW [Pelagicoccus sp. SDUM812003]|uniref:chemotaxis protein CheW n=1 Tax=Pelagicoccus sp. SDUM812003 TaxID=3041267 RepID=UPI00280DC1CF|nr:chemotaxis protein CheW [Pelagicoccus sp. SDUM812003]MDQ8203874.1 chemotaxis protein CheW [Pelagicoccus sp. SDUM812003]
MTTEPQNSNQFITFKLGDESFAINVSQVREVLDLTQITKVPTAPKYMKGVVNVRGSAIPVADLRLKFGLPEAKETVNSRILVLEITIDGEACVIGGIADSVHEVIELDQSQIDPPPTIAMRWKSEFIHGMGKRNDQFVIMLDIDAVFSSDEAIISKAAKEAEIATSN